MPQLLILTGPTASGKTALAIRVARELALEIVGADSRQVYEGLAVATAAPDAAEQALVRHHLVGHVNIREDYSAGRFARECRALLGFEQATGPGVAPASAAAALPFLLCGGSGFYLRALLDPAPPCLRADPSLRERVRNLSAGLDGQALRAHLLELDPAAAWIPPGDRARLERYLEICLAAGRPASLAMIEQAQPRPMRALIVALEAPLDWLEVRIAARTARMLEQGMVEEVALALEAGVPRTANALRSVGVEDVIELIEGRVNLATCAERINLRTRQLAKRQLTWQRGLSRREPLLLLDPRTKQEELTAHIVAAFRAAAGGA